MVLQIRQKYVLNFINILDFGSSNEFKTLKTPQTLRFYQ